MDMNRFLTKPLIGALINQRGEQIDIAIERLNQEGFPQPDPIVGNWWGPAVKAFFDRRSGIAPIENVTANPNYIIKIDGEENWS